MLLAGVDHSDMKFQCVGRALLHRAQVKSSSRTMLRSAQAGQRRKTTLSVKSPGCGTRARSSALDTADQESGSGQYPVDWLVTSVTRQPVSACANVISPAARTSRPSAQVTCSLRRGASQSTPSRSTTKVRGSASSPAVPTGEPNRRARQARPRQQRQPSPRCRVARPGRHSGTASSASPRDGIHLTGTSPHEF
jgi:hypothetical protein